MAAVESKEDKEVRQVEGVRKAKNEAPKQGEGINYLQEDKELERLAVESLLTEARRGKARAENVGTMGWVKRRQVNKRFLNSVVLQTVSSRAKRKRFEGEKSDVGWTQRDGGESEGLRHSRASERRKEAREVEFREKKRERGDSKSQKQRRDVGRLEERQDFHKKHREHHKLHTRKAGRNDT